jgi:hypothetical protein
MVTSGLYPSGIPVATSRQFGLDPDKLLAEAEAFLDSVQAAEGIGRKLCRSLVGFIESEVVPPATRAADQGIDPTPIMETVADLLRLFADSLDRPDLDGSTDQQLGSDGPT